MASMSPCSLTREGSVVTLTMSGAPDSKGNFENRFNPDFALALHRALDEVEASVVGEEGKPGALVITSSGKFFSNGLDLAWMGEHPERAEEIPQCLHVSVIQISVEDPPSSPHRPDPRTATLTHRLLFALSTTRRMSVLHFTRSTLC